MNDIASELIYDDNSIALQKSASSKLALMPFISTKSFHVERLLGRGSYAKVFEVTKIDTGEKFAMKVLKKSKMETDKDVQRLFNEKEIIKNINHPFIIRLHYTFQNKKKAYFVLDYLNGGDLYTRILTMGKLKESHTKFYAAEIVLALECLHKNSIVYRDLKPQNIIIDSEGHIKLTDFGLSKQDFDENDENSICGTMKYIAPETISGKKYNHMADWWSLGIIIYRMLTGQLPHPTNVNRRIPYYIVNYAIPIKGDDFTKYSQDLLQRLLERKPSKRLGANGVDEIKNHKFFRDINWKRLYKRKVKAPYIPSERSKLLGVNEKQIEDTPECDLEMEKNNMNDQIFEDFTYPTKPFKLTGEDSLYATESTKFKGLDSTVKH